MGLKEEHEETIRRGQEERDNLINKVRKALLELSIEDMKSNLRELSNDDLSIWCDIKNPQHEDYEICQAVNEILAERNDSKENK